MPRCVPLPAVASAPEGRPAGRMVRAGRGVPASDRSCRRRCTPFHACNAGRVYDTLGRLRSLLGSTRRVLVAATFVASTVPRLPEPKNPGQPSGGAYRPARGSKECRALQDMAVYRRANVVGCVASGGIHGRTIAVGPDPVRTLARRAAAFSRIRAVAESTPQPPHPESCCRR